MSGGEVFGYMSYGIAEEGKGKAVLFTAVHFQILFSEIE